MDISPLQHSVKASDLPLEKVANNANLSDADKVAEVSRQFEAVLLRQIISDAQKPGLGASPLANSVSRDIYRDMITTQLADSISKSGAFGLASSIQPQLTHQLIRAPKTDESSPTQLESNFKSPAAETQRASKPRALNHRPTASAGIRLEPRHP
jgi:Rod binding domain-containing protein